MDVATPVSVSCSAIGLQNHSGVLVAISPLGFYEVNLDFGERGSFRALLPIASTALLSLQPIAVTAGLSGIER